MVEFEADSNVRMLFPADTKLTKGTYEVRNGPDGFSVRLSVGSDGAEYQFAENQLTAPGSQVLPERLGNTLPLTAALSPMERRFLKSLSPVPGAN